MLPLAGFAAADGTFSVIEALLWTTAGSVIGAVVVYLLGALLGRDRTRALIGRIPLMRHRDFDRAEVWFRRYGTAAVFLGRMVPIFRSVISLPAGVERMPVVKFLALTTAGSVIWNTAFVMAGYLLGANWHLVENYASIAQKIVIVAVVAALAVFVALRLRSRAREAG